MGSKIVDGVIDRWADQAVDDLGDKGWKEVDTNSLLLVVYAVQKAEGRKNVSRVTKPFWWLLAVVAPGVIWYIVSGKLGL